MNLKRLLGTELAQPHTTIAGAGRFAEVRRASTLLLLVIAIVVGGLVVWAALAEVETVTRADGKVVPSSRLQVVQSLEGGVVERFAIRQGMPVKEGDVLVTLSAAQFGADFQSRSQQLLALQARVARLAAQAEGREPRLGAAHALAGAEYAAREQAIFFERQRQMEAQLAVLEAQISQRRRELQEAEVGQQTAEKTLGIAREERQIIAHMVERGLEPRLELVRVERDIADAEGRAAATAVSRERLKAAIQEIESRRRATEREFRAEAAMELGKALAEQRAIEETMPALKDKLARTELRAPVSGIVNRSLITTVGGVVKPGEAVAEIVPADDQLVVEALVQPKDIAFIRLGQPAKVKISAYDYAIFGAMDGRVASISADAVPVGEHGQTFYQVRVETSTTAIESLGKKLPIIPGMQAQVDIVTGSKTVLDYLAKPLVGVKENAFRER